MVVLGGWVFLMSEVPLYSCLGVVRPAPLAEKERASERDREGTDLLQGTRKRRILVSKVPL